MGKGKKHESAAQERKNLLGINPIPDHASGSWMSKHSIASSGSMSPLHLKGFKGEKSDMSSTTRKEEEPSTWQKVKNWVGKYDWNLKSRPPGGRSLIKHTSKGGQAGFSGDTRP